MSNQDPNFRPEQQNNQYGGTTPSHTPPHYPYATVKTIADFYRDAVAMIKPLAICMIIQGCLEILVGLAYIGGCIASAIIFQAAPGGRNALPQQNMQLITTISMIVYGGLGSLVGIAGGLRVFAGIRSLDYRSHQLALVSHFAGLISIFSCYCVPTAIGLSVWGCIVHFKPEIKYAYQLREAGYKAQDIETGRPFEAQDPAGYGNYMR